MDTNSGTDFIDLTDTYVVNLPDAREKLKQTLIVVFKRVHLLVGLFQKHRKFTRVQRVFTLLLLWVAVQCLNTLFHAVAGFPVQGSFVATGLVSGVLVWPLIQLVIVLYEYCPETKVLVINPPTAQQAQPIPLKLQARPPSIFSPGPPVAPGRSAVPQLPIVKFAP
eukprot:1746994-Amphidinium_carterae.1